MVHADTKEDKCFGINEKNTNDQGKLLPDRIIEFSGSYFIPAKAKSFLTRTGNYP
jgi:hypothetical protein